MSKQTRIPDRIIFNDTNLNAVTTATNGDSIDLKWYNKITFFVNCTVNTGAVTVKTQGSVDGTIWDTLDTVTYTGSIGNNTYHYGDTEYYFFYRTTTSTQSNSTVTTKVIAHN